MWLKIVISLMEQLKKVKIKNYKKDHLFLQVKIVEILINLINKMHLLFKGIEIKKYVFSKKPQKLGIDFSKEIQKIFLKIFVKHL